MKKSGLRDRYDAWQVRNLDPIHRIMNYVIGTRTENEAVCKFELETSALNEYIKNKNKDCADKRLRYTFFHAVLAALARTAQERKAINYFVRDGRFWERKQISFSYVAKKYKQDGSAESLILQNYHRDSDISPIQQMHDRTCKEVSTLREADDCRSNSDKTIDNYLKMPHFILRPVIAFIRFLDRKGRIPKSLQKIIPYYSTFFVSNLGSIKLNSEYHHLTNFGTNSLFVIIGEKFTKPQFKADGTYQLKEFLPITITLDERIADGVYYGNTLRLLQAFLLKPELLDLPAKTEIDCASLVEEVFGGHNGK